MSSCVADPTPPCHCHSNNNGNSHLLAAGLVPSHQPKPPLCRVAGQTHRVMNMDCHPSACLYMGSAQFVTAARAATVCPHLSL